MDRSNKHEYVQDNTFYNETIRNDSCERETVRFRRTIAVVLTACFAGGAALGFGYGAGSKLAADYWIPRMSKDNRELRNYTISVGYAGTTDGAFPVFSYADVLSQVEQAVVYITSTQTDDPLCAAESTGILFFESENNYYIATSAHITEGASNIYVSINNSQSMSLNCVGVDSETNIAVASLSKTDAYNAGITPVTLASFGDSNTVKAGDVVLSISGDASGQGRSIASGIVSIGRHTDNQGGAKSLPIRFNIESESGAPIINLAGEVVGMNTAKSSDGANYSVPSNNIVPAVEKIMRESAGT